MTILAMNLKISPRKIIKIIGWSLAAIVFLVFFVRIVTFEDWYYNSKEGSERAVVESAEDIAVEEEFIEEEPTVEEVREYTVAADRPRYLSIEKLGIVNARVLAVGVTAAGAMDTPRSVFDVGWYDGSDKPGQGGTMVIDGHNGGPHVNGVFKKLPSLVHGDIIKIERGDGVVYQYKVVENVTVSLEDANAYMKTARKSPEKGKESLSLITCTGEWSNTRKTYLSRQFVRAVLVD